MQFNFERTPNILIVDDIPLNVELLKTYLKSSGYNVDEAGDGLEALEKISKNKPDLVLLDIMMPKMNGFDVCQKIKSDSSMWHIPVVMVTALQSIEDKVKGIEAGADDFITKPFNKLELLARVKSLLRIKFLHDELVKKVEELNQARKHLHQLAVTDGLTHLYNHRFFRERLLHEVNRAERQKSQVSLIMLDIDYFKFYNDANGHPAGDEVLRVIAKLIRNNVRKIDIPARYGGEEFVVILPDTDARAARVVAEKLRSLVEKQPVPHEEKQPNGKLTISVGVATFPKDANEEDRLISIADQRLYKAKQRGRNTIVAD